MMGIIDEIQMKLKEIEEQEHVTILHAVSYTHLTLPTTPYV